MKNILFQNLFGSEAISIYADSQMFMSDYPFNKEQNMINIYNEDSGYDESLNNLNYKFYTINTKYVSFTGGNPAQNIVIIKIQYDPLSNLITDISEQYILCDGPTIIGWRTLVSSNINLTYNDAINGGSDTLTVFGLIGNGGGNSILQNDTACGTIIYTDGSNDIIFNPNYGSIVVDYTSTQQTVSFVLEEPTLPTLPTQPIQPLNILPPPLQNSFENAYIAFNCGNSNIIALLKITYETNTNIVFSISEIYRERSSSANNTERFLFYGSNTDYTYNPNTNNFINTLEYELYGLVSNSALQNDSTSFCGKVVFISGNNATFSAYSIILNYINIYQETATIVFTSPFDITTILTHDIVIHDYNSVYVSFTGGLNSQIIVILKLTYMVDSGLITTIQEKFLVRSGNGMVGIRTLLTNTTLKSYIYNSNNNTYTFSETVVVDVFGLIGTSSSGTPLLNDNAPCGIIEFISGIDIPIIFTPMITISDYAQQVQMTQFVLNEPDAPIQPIIPNSVTQPSYAPKELNLLHDNETNKLRITAKTGIALQADSLTNVTPVNTNTFELATYELDGTTVSSGVYVGDIYTKMKNANNTDVNVNIGKELADIRSKLVDVGTTNIGNIVDHILRIEKVLTSLTNVSFAPTSDFISINNLAAHDTP